ncbi:MAG: PCMD domain-containing protein [Bacteroidales bacterium]|jgi:hypothetical protein|nr:PCMD domain-containing protein [Bacteroidales bacterium]
MMKKLLVLFVFVGLLMSCNEEESGSADIIDLSVTRLSNDALSVTDIKIDSYFNKLFIFFDNDLTQHPFPLTITSNIKLSSGAKMSTFADGELEFSSPDEAKQIVVEAEDGTQEKWYLYLIHQQIQNADFEHWFTNVGMNGKAYEEIGYSLVESFWATANMGTSMYSTYGTQPVYEGEETLVQVKTDSTSQVPVTAGTLFTGRFDISGAIANPTDPKKATFFGIPFRHRPEAMQVWLKYQAGDQTIQASLRDPNNIFGGFTVTELDDPDQCSVYAILEHRDDQEVVEIARAEFSSTTTADELTLTTIPFVYSANELPTHLTVVFTSSKEGDLWKGAVGSTLIVDKLKMIY